MYEKRKLTEFDLPFTSTQRLRFTHDSVREEIYVQEVYPSGEVLDDLLTLREEHLSDVIDILKEIRGY